eukprot:scaffold462_cov195-Pinguiococcus_pyrenoidosus.AAC.50
MAQRIGDHALQNRDGALLTLRRLVREGRGQQGDRGVQKALLGGGGERRGRPPALAVQRRRRAVSGRGVAVLLRRPQLTGEMMPRVHSVLVVRARFVHRALGVGAVAILVVRIRPGAHAARGPEHGRFSLRVLTHGAGHGAEEHDVVLRRRHRLLADGEDAPHAGGGGTSTDANAGIRSAPWYVGDVTHL